MTTCTDSVLLIDDSEIDLFINKKILEFNHFSKQITSTTSPLKALEMLSTTDNELPEVVFLDLNMPIMDGFKFIRAFSALPKFVQENVSIVVLTSSENIHDRRLARESDRVVHFVSKPLTDEKVIQLKSEFSLAKSLPN